MKRVPFLFASATPMAQRHRAFAWDASPLGPPEAWDAALKTLVPIMLASNQAMFIVWGPSRTLLYNDPYGEILGDKHRDALGRDFLEVWHEIRTDLAPIVEAAYRGEPVQMDDILLWMERRGYREETHFSFFYAPVRDESGEVGGFFCACNEITAEVIAERRLAESEAQYRGVLANMDEGFTLFDADFNILEINEQTVGLTGFSREELIGENHWTRFPGTYDSVLGQMYRQALASGEPGTVSHMYEYADGRKVWYDVRAFPVEDKLAVFFRDVTRRRTMEAEAALAADRAQLALDAGAIIGTWVWHVPEDRFIGDERFAASFGLDAEACRRGMPTAPVFRAIHPDDVEHVRAVVTDALARGGPYRCEYRVRGADGRERWIEANGRVELDADGQALRFPGVLLDIEQRRRTQAERDRAETLLRTFIEAVPGVAYAKDREGRFLMANRGTAELLGLPPDRFIGRTDIDVLANRAEAEAITANDRRIMDAGVVEQIEEAVQLADGTPAFWWSTKAPLRDGSGAVVGLIGASVDITDRKRMEDALRLSEQRSALAMDVAQLGTWVWDLASGAVTVDARCRELCGLAPGDDTLTFDVVAAHIHPEDRARVEQALSAALASADDASYSEEFRWVHADGTVVWTASRGLVRHERTAGGAKMGTMIGSVIDVTERRQILESLTQADRRKDEFLAMLAHELRNPLAPINAAAHVLLLSAADPRRVHDASTMISRQVGHLTRLVDDLLDVSRVTRGLVHLERQPVDLRSVASTAVEQVRPLVEARRHELRTRVGAGHITVSGDFHRLVQVVSNLLNNAAKYTPQGGVIELALGSDNGRARLSVTDSGVGIAPHMTDQVFDLFTQAERTPDRSQGGLGIGLALVRSLVTLHGGQVRAESAGLHRGSTFHVELPLSTEMPARPAPTTAPSNATGRRILLVDDNTDAAATLAELLQLVGHTVAVAHDGESALAQAGDGTAWDTFILDIGLPDMTGYELAERLRASHPAPAASFIALTGYGQPHDRVISRASGFDHHLVKPADIPRLIDMLAKGG